MEKNSKPWFQIISAILLVWAFYAIWEKHFKKIPNDRKDISTSVKLISQRGVVYKNLRRELLGRMAELEPECLNGNNLVCERLGYTYSRFSKVDLGNKFFSIACDRGHEKSCLRKLYYEKSEKGEKLKPELLKFYCDKGLGSTCIILSHRLVKEGKFKESIEIAKKGCFSNALNACPSYPYNQLRVFKAEDEKIEDIRQERRKDLFRKLVDKDSYQKVKKILIKSCRGKIANGCANYQSFMTAVGLKKEALEFLREECLGPKNIQACGRVYIEPSLYPKTMQKRDLTESCEYDPTACKRLGDFLEDPLEKIDSYFKGCFAHMLSNRSACLNLSDLIDGHDKQSYYELRHYLNKTKP